MWGSLRLADCQHKGPRRWRVGGERHELQADSDSGLSESRGWGGGSYVSQCYCHRSPYHVTVRQAASHVRKTKPCMWSEGISGQFALCVVLRKIKHTARIVVILSDIIVGINDNNAYISNRGESNRSRVYSGNGSCRVVDSNPWWKRFVSVWLLVCFV